AADVLANIAPAAPQLLDERTRSGASARVDIAKANLRRMRSAAARAATQLAYADRQLQRGRRLLAEDGLSPQEVERVELQQSAASEELAAAQLNVDAATHELAAARAALVPGDGMKSKPTKLSVVAPAAGRVLRVFAPSAGIVQAGAPLIEVGDPSELEVVVDVLTTDAVRIQPGADARIDGWGGEYPLAAHVRRKEPSAYATRSALGVEEQRVSVVLDLVDPNERRLAQGDGYHVEALGDGYRVDAHIRVAKREQTLAVPSAALFRASEGWAAFVVRDDAKLEQVDVALGLRSADWTEVTQGLGRGDFVVEYPTDLMSDGVRVTQLGKR
ncbi:MAG TPA: HlyD family efflux transporter periplasmic adaptor subunit, partial [Polyangiales bacterium]|nr:HlyD family efflux transporter periplasmic adaptor subunit [Polyangiales bacterium]